MSGVLPKVRRHRVTRGDSLWKIAEHAYGHGDLWEEISAANHLKRGKPILIGQELFIPMAHQSTHPSLHKTLAGVPQTSPEHHPTIAPSLPLQHLGTHVANAASRSGPFQGAKPVLFPAFKYELNGIVAEYFTPVADYKLSLTGEVTLQKEGVITGGLTFTKKGVETEYKKEADGVFNALFTKCGAKVEDGKAEVSLAIGSTLKSGSQVLATTETSLIPPNGIKYTFKGQEIKGIFKGYEFGGVMGYELEIHLKGVPRQPEGHRVQVKHWAKVAGVGLVIVAGVIVVGDIVKDVFTLGAGTVESPLSFAAAAELFGTGMVMVRATAH